MMSDSDAEVIEASWRDPERFSVLFDRHAPSIRRYLARRVGQAADDMPAAGGCRPARGPA